MDMRFLRMNGIHQVGQVVRNYHPGAAAELIRRGIAEPLASVAQSPAPPGQPAGDATGETDQPRHGKKHRR
jgi:hypothetical protein